jgi:asparagine synthase (glutamine-hydrolysing)
VSGLEPLTVGTGLVFGVDHVELPRTDLTPLEALEDAIVPFLERAPCLVSFSGGRDSSAVLAVAADVARRHGLPLPVPATNRFPEAPGSDEDAWQEQVVSHLQLEDWIRIEHRDELDVVGPVATQTLRRHGLLWPFNAFFHVPLLRAARGGSLLTGIGGDEVLSEAMTTRPVAVLTGRARPTRGDLKPTAWSLAPRPLRAAALRRRHPARFPWLRPAAERDARAAIAEQNAREPLRARAHLAWRLGFRYLGVGRQSLGLLADDVGAAISHPLLDPAFAAAVAALPGRVRHAGRTALMRELFGSLLPSELVERTSKSHFDEAFWNRASRRFAAAWDGSGVDAELVDADALRREWADERPNPRTYTLLQSAWLASADDGREHAVDVAVDAVPAA